MRVPQSRVSDWENDRYGLPDTSTLLKIAKTLGCSIDDLLSGVDPRYDTAASTSVNELLEKLRAMTGTPAKPVKAKTRVPNAIPPDRDAVIAEIRAVAARLGRGPGGGGDDAGEFVDISGSVRDDLPVIGEGEASPRDTLFWDDTGALLARITDRIRRPYDVRDPRAYGVRVRGDSMIPIYEPGMTVVVSPSRPVRSGHRVYLELTSGERLVKIARKAGDGWMLESANPAHEPRFVRKSDVKLMHRIVWVREPDDDEHLVDEENGGKRRR